jgi:hypothetical protein
MLRGVAIGVGTTISAAWPRGILPVADLGNKSGGDDRADARNCVQPPARRRGPTQPTSTTRAHELLFIPIDDYFSKGLI